MEKEQNFSLFGNLKSFLISIVAGALMFTLLVPRFVNNLHSLFNIGYVVSYYIFVFAYFILAFLILIVWFRYRGLQGFNLIIRIPPSAWFGFPGTALIGVILLICMIVFFSLICTDPLADYAFIIICPLLIGYFIWQVRRLRFSDKAPHKLNSIDYEYILLFFISLVAAGFFIYGNIKSSKAVLKENEFGNAVMIIRRHHIYVDFKNEIADDVPALKNTIEAALYRVRLNSRFITDTANHDKTPKVDPSYHERLVKAVIWQRAHLDSLKEVDSLLKNKAFDSGLSPIVRLNFAALLDTLPNQKKNSSQGDKYLQDSTILILKDEMINAYQPYTLFIGRRWEDYMKDKWSILIQKLQFKGMLWFFTLYFLCVSVLYFTSFRLKFLGDKQRIADLAEAQKKSKEQHYRSWESLQKEWLEKQLATAIPTKSNDRMDRLNTTRNTVRSFVLLLVLFITPFFRHIGKEDIDLERPFLNFDASKLTGIDALKPVEAKPTGTSSVDSTVRIYINSFNTSIRDTLNTLPAGIPSFTSDSVNLNDLRRKIDSLKRETDSWIEREFDDDPQEIERIKNGQ